MKYLPGGQRTINKMSYWAARGLTEFHAQLKKKLHEVEAMIAMFLGEPEDPDSPGYWGHVSDGLWSDSDIDKIMNNLGIGFKEDQNEPV
jgi:hypothetical protein